MKANSRLAPVIAALTAGSLAGCPATAPTFPGQPGAPAGTAAVIPPTAAPAQPGTPTAAPATTNFSGTVTLPDAPVANATLKVQNALTGEDLPVLAAGAAATGLAVYADSLKTDDKGAYTLKLANVTKDSVLRVVATSGKITMSALFMGDGTTLGKKGYVTLDGAPGVSVTVTSTYFDHATGKFITMQGAVTDGLAGANIRSLFAALSLSFFLAQASTAFNKALADAIKAGDFNAAQAVVSKFPEYLKVALAMSNAMTTAFTQLLDEAKDPKNVKDLGKVTSLSVPEAGLTITMSGSSVVITVADGSITSFALPGSTTSSGGTGGTGGGGSGGTTFLPLISNPWYDGSNLTMVVTQPSNSVDVKNIFVRVPNTIAYTGAFGVLGNGASLTPSGTNTVQLTSANVTRTLNVVKNIASTSFMETNAFDGSNLPGTFAFTGDLQDTTGGGNTKLGQVAVFDQGSYHYLLLSYREFLGNAVSHGGSITTLTTNAFQTFPGNTSVEAIFTSGDNRVVKYTGGDAKKSESFSPQLTSATFTGGNLQMVVNQPTNEIDVQNIFLRVPSSIPLSPTFNALTTLTPGGTTNKVHLTTANVDDNLSLVQDNTGTPTETTLPAAFGGGAIPGTLLFKGFLKDTTANAIVARASVFDQGGYHYMLLSYSLTGGVIPHGGNTTTLTTNAFQSFAAGTTVQAVFTSRNNQVVSRTITSN